MADGDIIEVNGVPGVMVHIYNPITFEYMNSYHKTFEDPSTPGRYATPGNGTKIAPPTVNEHEKAVWDVTTTLWSIKPDYRNKFTYHPTDHTIEPILIEDLDVDINSGWLLDRPYYFAEHKEKKYLELKQGCSNEIYEGFVSNALGVDHHYPCKALDQQTLNYQISEANIDGASAEPYKFWCTTDLVNTENDAGWARRDHTAVEIINVGRSASVYVSSCKDKFELRISEYLAATNESELDAIIWI